MQIQSSLPSYITFEPLEKIISLLQNRQIAILVDENTKKFCYPVLEKIINQTTTLSKPVLIEIKAGEIYKTLATCQYIWQQLTEANFDRKAVLLNLGGGVIGDMGGFCAATYKRGIDFIQIPTTLLSQVDASVGGKVGVDFNGFKNHIGVFQLPLKVWIHTPFLQTLPAKEMRSGFAEVIKHSLIADKKEWQNFSENNKISVNNFENQSVNLDWDTIILSSVSLKSTITQSDPTEKGLRKILNFGHTIGHAIESYFIEENKKNTTIPVFLHGEAIALGMIAESYFSAFLWNKEKNNAKNSTKEEYNKIKNYITFLYQDVINEFREAIKNTTRVQEIVEWTKQDKKNTQNQILTCALEEIGKATFDNPISEAEIKECLCAI